MDLEYWPLILVSCLFGVIICVASIERYIYIGRSIIAQEETQSLQQQQHIITYGGVETRSEV